MIFLNKFRKVVNQNCSTITSHHLKLAKNQKWNKDFEEYLQLNK